MYLRHLIINGDDLGISEEVNRAIFDLHQSKIITSASLLVDGKAAQAAVYDVKNYFSNLSLGLHLDFGEPPFRIDWLVKQMRLQWEKFHRLVGETPTHVDIHNFPDIAVQLARFLPERVPMRKVGTINYIDKFNGSNGVECVSLAYLIKLLRRIKKGVYELSCCPGYTSEEHAEHKGECGACRERQFRTLLDKRVKLILNIRKINLISYRDLLRSEQFRIHILDRVYTTF